VGQKKLGKKKGKRKVNNGNPSSGGPLEIQDSLLMAKQHGPMTKKKEKKKILE